MHRRSHGKGWVTPKSLMEGIRAELVPATLAVGWVPLERQPARKGSRRFGEFEFERVSTDRIEHMGFDFQFGDKPDIWLCLALWTGEGGACTLFQTGNCWNYSERGEPFWRKVRNKLRREQPLRDPLAEALAKGLQRLQIAEAYLQEGIDHRDLGLTRTLPPHSWPDGYADRIR